MCFTQSKWGETQCRSTCSYIPAIFGRSTSILNAASSARTIGPAEGFIREEVSPATHLLCALDTAAAQLYWKQKSGSDVRNFSARRAFYLTLTQEIRVFKVEV